jgi:nucleoside-diphosphate-sugar epimerase
MRIVVTGAAGGIGRAVLPDLVTRGHEVVAVDRVLPGTREPGSGGVGAAPAEGPSDFRDAAGIEWLLGDGRDESLLARALAGADALIHLAAIPTPLLGTPVEVFASNTQTTFTALEAAGTAGVARAVIASSISLLGLPYATGPLSPLYAPVDEAHPNIGTDAYALSKEADERTAAMMHRRHGYQVVALRIPATAPMAVHLERQRHVARDPSYLANELWAYLDVRDAARAFGLAVERDIPGLHVVNVMAPDTYSGLPTAELMARAHPGTVLRRPLVGRESVFDTTRGRELLGFVPSHRLVFGELKGDQ